MRKKVAVTRQGMERQNLPLRGDRWCKHQLLKSFADDGMQVMKKAALPFALLIAGAISGCAGGPQFLGHRENDSCHEPGSDAWWAERALVPPGVRQKCKNGKMWPARPRSTEPEQPFSHIYHAQHYWPLPYTCQDRQAVWGMMEAQTALGWQDETTLYDRHFDEMTQQLSRSGELQLDYILHVVPVERRAIYVQSTYDTGLDSARVEAVTAMMSRGTSGAGDVTVAIRDCQQVGRPAAEVQTINSAYLSTMPAPRLSSASAGAGASSTSSGSTP